MSAIAPPTSELPPHAFLNDFTNSSTVRARNALYRSGRLIVIQASPFSTSYVTSVKSLVKSLIDLLVLSCCPRSVSRPRRSFGLTL